MNNTYRQIVLSRIRAAVDAAKAVEGVTHTGLKGQLREVVIRDLFRPLFPDDIGLGTGEIITSTNQHSQQQDVIIYDKRILPPILLEHNTGVFPLEAALYAIEVKSTLNAHELKTSHKSAKMLQEFDYLPARYYDVHNNIISKPMAHLISAIIAFDSDLSPDGKTEVERYKEVDGEQKPAIKVICVVGKGYWYWNNDEWVEWNIKYPLEEVLMFVTGVMNTYTRIIAAKGTVQIGSYLGG